MQNTTQVRKYTIILHFTTGFSTEPKPYFSYILLWLYSIWLVLVMADSRNMGSWINGIHIPDFCIERWHRMMVALLRSESFHREDELPILINATESIHSSSTEWSVTTSVWTVWNNLGVGLTGPSEPSHRVQPFWIHHFHMHCAHTSLLI